MKNYILVVFLFCQYTAYFQSNEIKRKIDSLELVLKESRSVEQKIRSYYELSNCYYTDDAEKMKYYTELLSKLSQKHKSPIGWALYHINMSNYYYLKRDPKKAVNNSKKAIEILKKTKEIKYYLTAVICVARSYNSFGDDKSLKKLLDSHYKLFSQFGDSKLLGDFYMCYGLSYNLGINKEETLNYKKALYYYDLCNEKDGKAWLYYRIARSYRRIKLAADAMEYLNKAVDLHPTNHVRHLIELEKAKVYNELGQFKEAKELIKSVQCYFDKAKLNDTDIYFMIKLADGRSDFGLKNYKSAIQKCNQILDKNAKSVTTINALNTISLSYHELGQNVKAKHYIEKAGQLINDKSDTVGEVSIEDYYRIRSRIEKALGNFKRAWYYNQIYFDYIDKNSKKFEKEQYEQNQIKFEVAEKENQIRKLKIADLQKNLLIQKQRNYILITVFILIIATIAFVTFIVFYRTIMAKNKIIEENVSKLEKLLNEKELLLKEIHHRVKNNFQLVTSLLSIQSREVNSKDIKEFVEKGQSRIISMALIHENLYQTDKLDKVNFQEYVENLVDNIKSSFQFENSKINTKIKTIGSNFDIQTSIPLGLIINELYCNILKYAFPNQEGNIAIELIKKGETDYQLTISDDGVGIDKTEKNNKSIGLELVYMLVEQLNGTIELLKDNGTKYSINFKEIVG